MQNFDNFKRKVEFLKQNTTFQSYFTVKSTSFNVFWPPMTVLVVGQRLSTVLQHLNRQETLQDALWTDQELIKHANPSQPTPPTNHPKIFNGRRNFFAPLLPYHPILYSLTTLLKPCRRVAHHTGMASDSRTQRMLVILTF